MGIKALKLVTAVDTSMGSEKIYHDEIKKYDLLFQN